MTNPKSVKGCRLQKIKEVVNKKYIQDIQLYMCATQLSEEPKQKIEYREIILKVQLKSFPNLLEITNFFESDI